MTWQDRSMGMLGKFLILVAAWGIFAVATGLAILAGKFLVWAAQW